MSDIQAELTALPPDVEALARPAATPDVATAEAKADRARFGYQPALDGLRAVAVLGVLVYHGVVGWGKGAFLGVDVFFTLSGYLITTLLLRERGATRGVDLKGFWIRRARRLLPALFLVTVAVIIYAAFFADSLELDSIRGDAIASLLYVANWRFIASGQSYFAQYLAPSPLRHTWSLAIEEQWYLFWPIVFTLGYKFTKFRSRNWAIGLLVVAALSGGLMAVLFHEGSDPSRIYFGTDTRAQPLLIGAALAFALHGRTLNKVSLWLLQLIGVVGLLGIFAMFVFVDDAQAWMYRGGFTVISVVTGAVIVATMAGRPTFTRRFLAFGPLPLIGRMSYGLYLWHWPIYVFMTANRTGITNPNLLLLARLVVTFAVSALSYNLVEMPVRNGALRRLAASIAPRDPGLVVVSGAVLAAVLLAGCVVLSTETPSQAASASVAPGDTKVLLLGDSVIFTLGNAIPKQRGIAIQDGGLLGCGVTESRRMRNGVEIRMPDDRCSGRLDAWAKEVKEFSPHVTALSLGGWEAFDLAENGKIHTFGTPEFAKFLNDQLNNNLKVITAGGGKVVMLTIPCTDPQPQDGSTPEPERHDQSRLIWLDNLATTWAKKHPNDVKVIDLRGHLCPDNEYRDKLNGVPLYRDGEHFTQEGATEVWKWLGPQIKKAVGQT